MNEFLSGLFTRLNDVFNCAKGSSSNYVSLFSTQRRRWTKLSFLSYSSNSINFIDFPLNEWARQFCVENVYQNECYINKKELILLNMVFFHVMKWFCLLHTINSHRTQIIKNKNKKQKIRRLHRHAHSCSRSRGIVQYDSRRSSDNKKQESSKVRFHSTLI